MDEYEIQKQCSKRSKSKAQNQKGSTVRIPYTYQQNEGSLLESTLFFSCYRFNDEKEVHELDPDFEDEFGLRHSIDGYNLNRRGLWDILPTLREKATEIQREYKEGVLPEGEPLVYVLDCLPNSDKIWHPNVTTFQEKVPVEEPLEIEILKSRKGKEVVLTTKGHHTTKRRQSVEPYRGPIRFYWIASEDALNQDLRINSTCTFCTNPVKRIDYGTGPRAEKRANAVSFQTESSDEEVVAPEALP